MRAGSAWSLVVVAAATLGAVTTTVCAQEKLTEHTLALPEDGATARATIKEVAWLEGRWGAEAFGGWCAETWSPPHEGGMLGMFRLLNDGKPVFFELLTLSEEKGGVLMRVKHFNPDLVGWEEKDGTVDFPLVAFSPTILQFRGLTFKRVDDNRIDVFLAMRKQDGSFREERFTYRRLVTTTPIAEQ